MKSVIENFVFVAHPKWTIALDRPASGNTRKIGGVDSRYDLINGTGPLAVLAEDVFEEYWMNYYHKPDAHSAGIGIPQYNNLASYPLYTRGQREKITR
jgi:Restriction endonuclease EcoRV.